MNTKLRIGVTVGLSTPQESLWVNGIKQNAVFLCEALRHCPCVESACLVNMTAVDTSAIPWNRDSWPTFSFADAKDDLDVLIELGGQIDATQTDYMKDRGARVVSYCCGVEYVNVAQSIIFGRNAWPSGIYVNPRYDAVWLIPQVADTSRHFFQSFRRCPAEVVPFVWDPVFLRERARDLPNGGEYTPRSGAARVSVIEPNIDLVKFCLYPILITEEAYRRSRESIGFLTVGNSKNMAESDAAFISLMMTLDLVKDHKATFIGRLETPEFLAQHTDAVVSHQWGNPLNYLYLEVCWQGFPLIHNASLCKGLGYYYPDNDVEAGAAALLRAIETHDENYEAYRSSQRSQIKAYLPGNADVTSRYESLLSTLVSRPIR